MIYNDDDLSFRILTVSRFFHKEGVFEVKARPYAAFSYRVSGTCLFEIDGKVMSAKVGDVLYIPAGTPYKVEYSVGESIVVHFEYCSYSEAENISLSNPSEIGLQFLKLLELWGSQHSISQAKSIIYDIFDKIENDQKLSIKEGSVAACIQYMQEHFCDPELDIEAVCSASFISVSSLQRAFAKYFGISPGQYLIGLRMNRALELLREDALPVKEIAFLCGFSDEKYFSRAFKKRYGTPPSQLKKHMMV
jgi:AraC-like DNA-binding protein